MFKKSSTAIKSGAILGLILVVAISVAWATSTYSGSRVYQLGDPGAGFVIKSGKDRVRARVRPNALDDYLTEQGLSEVEITGEMTEELVECEDGTTHYHLNFTFGPSGTYFNVSSI